MFEFVRIRYFMYCARLLGVILLFNIVRSEILMCMIVRSEILMCEFVRSEVLLSHILRSEVSYSLFHTVVPHT